MSSTAFAPERGANDTRPMPVVAARAARRGLHTAWRAVRAFGGAVIGVIVLGEYADRRG